jgi:trehalose synthase
MEEVKVGQAPLKRFVELLTPQRADRFRDYVARGVALLEGRTVWNVNSTAQGGGVAEMLQTLLAYTRAAGVDTRWLVLEGDARFFVLTKRLHNLLHGQPGDGGRLGEAERQGYLLVMQRNLAALTNRAKPGDLVLLHDPQTAGLVRPLQKAGCHVVWRCHVGVDHRNQLTEEGWAFLRPFLEDTEGFVFSREQYAPDWMPADRLWIIPPSLDPFSAKNAPMKAADVNASLRRAGLVDAEPDHGSYRFVRRDGTTGGLPPFRALAVEGGQVPRGARVVLQVSRWDRLKDMNGVMRGFAEHIDELPSDVHLILAGPDVSGVTDDPEGAEVLGACRAMWRSLPIEVAARIHLCGLPMNDVDANAHLVNALQRYADIVVQKSLAEGFGLTVTEPMWKSRSVVASAIGGIQDQIVDGESGVLLPDPTDLEAFAAALVDLFGDPERADRLGTTAHDRVQDRFLADRHLAQYVDLFGSTINR